MEVTTALADAHTKLDYRSNATGWILTPLEEDTFALLRESWGVSRKKHEKRLRGGFRHFKSNSKGAARAGTLFFFSSDGAYLIKTVPRRERDVLLRMLPNYSDYMRKNGRSLMTKFLGVYDVEREGGSRRRKKKDAMTMVVMNSIFPVNAKLSERYDLKGSTVGRKCSAEERQKKKVRGGGGA